MQRFHHPVSARGFVAAAAAASFLFGASVAAAGSPRPATPLLRQDAGSVGLGDRGETVRWWQVALNDWLELVGSSRFPIVADGFFGDETEAAPREYPRADDDVVNDGTVGDDDRVAIEAAIAALEAEGAGDSGDGAGDDGETGPGGTVDADETVIWWQTALNEWLRLTESTTYPIVVDGILGGQTEAATREFQRSHPDVVNDGTVDGDDRVAIEAAIAALQAAGAAPSSAASDGAGDDGETGPGGTVDADETVIWWQTALNEWLRLTESTTYPIVVDGILGGQTEAATREFQRSHPDVVDDGTVDGDDRVAIEAAIAALEADGAGDSGDGVSAAETGTDEVVAAQVDEKIAWWQDRLNTWLELVTSSMFPIFVDGIFGPQTETATREFQRASDEVANDGIVDQNDRVALENSIDAIESGAGGESGTPDASDETILWWQAALNEWLLLTESTTYPIVADGIFGPQTEAATREFQRASADVVDDGTVDGDDRVAIEAAIAALGG